MPLGLVLPKIFEPGWCQLGITYSMLDILVSEIRLQRAGIDAVVCEFVPARMPQHMWVDSLYTRAKIIFEKRPSRGKKVVVVLRMFRFGSL